MVCSQRCVVVENAKLFNSLAPRSEDPRSLYARILPSAVHARRKAQSHHRHSAQGGTLGYPPPCHATAPASTKVPAKGTRSFLGAGRRRKQYHWRGGSSFTTPLYFFSSASPFYFFTRFQETDEMLMVKRSQLTLRSTTFGSLTIKWRRGNFTSQFYI